MYAEVYISRQPCSVRRVLCLNALFKVRVCRPAVYLKAACDLNNCKYVCHHNCPSWDSQGGQDVWLDSRAKCPVATECQCPVGHDDQRVGRLDAFVHVCRRWFSHGALPLYMFVVAGSRTVLWISGSIASPNEKAIVPNALKPLKTLVALLPCRL